MDEEDGEYILWRQYADNSFRELFPCFNNYDPGSFELSEEDKNQVNESRQTNAEESK